MANHIKDAAEIVVLLAKQHRSGMNAHPHLRGGKNAHDPAFHQFVDAQPCQRAAQRVVFGCGLHAEHRHHPVALHAHHQPAQFMDGLLDQQDRRIEQVARIVGFERGDQSGRSDDVGKQDGHESDGIEVARRCTRCGQRLNRVRQHLRFFAFGVES